MRGSLARAFSSRAFRARLAVAIAAMGWGLASPGWAIDFRTITYASSEEPFQVVDIGFDVPGLATIDLAYTDTDHHVASFKAGPLPFRGVSLFWLDLEDVDGNDPVRYTARFADLRAYGAYRLVDRICDPGGTCRIEIPAIAQGEIFVLSGVWFSNIELDDHHIREVAVDPHPYSGYVDVTFADDGRHPYQAFVQYMAIPAEAVLHLGHRSSGLLPPRGVATVTRERGAAVLQGFRLAFTNGDHHLKTLTVSLFADRVTVRFADQSGDDPFTWSVDYVILRE